MSVITIETPSLGDRTYVVHDGDVALVVDPQRDVDRVIDAAESAGVHITHVFESHVHNDYASGALTLSRLTGAALFHAASETLTFEHVPVHDGDALRVGALTVSVVATPGHTPHHLSFVVRCTGQSPAVFTGGSLLFGTVGRTDLDSEHSTEELTRAQHRSARKLSEALPDDAAVYPTHGFGSFCASTSSDAESDGTMGTERDINIALTTDDEDEFVERLTNGLSSYPAYYAHMGALNRSGPGPADLSPPANVDPHELARRIHRGEWVVDLRPRRDFAAAHVAGTIGVELSDQFSIYLGWVAPWGMPITLLADSADDITAAQRQLVRIGIDRPSGAATGDPTEWAPDTERRSYPVIQFDDLESTEGTVLDVRRDDEYVDEHIDRSVHVPLEKLLDRLDEVPDDRLLVHCASGYRASIAASLLDRSGRDVVLIDDTFEPTDTPRDEKVSPGRSD